MSIARTPSVEPSLSYGTLLGQVILRKRKSQGLDQAAVAQSVGVSQGGYSRLETGETMISLLQLRRIARVLDVTPYKLLREVDLLEARLRQAGVLVTDERSKEPGAQLMALGILTALLAEGE